MIGTTLSHYEIEAELGRGGMGVVYRARDIKLDRPVALKFLADHLTGDATARERFLREARAAAMLRHDSICAIHEVQKTAEGHVFIVMPLYEGRSLKEMLTGGPLSESKALSFARQIASGLKAAHAKDLIHRDIKPANLWVTDEERIKILDFGLAKLTGEVDLTQSGSTVGTMAYMAPEQVQNHDVDGRADLWALGVVLYEMLVGKRPFTGEYDAAVVYGIVNQEVDLDPVPRDARSLIKRLLAKDPEARYQTAEALIEVIDGLLVADTLGSSIGEEVGRVSSLSLSAWWKPVAVVFVVAVAGALWFGVRGMDAGVEPQTQTAPSRPAVGVMYFENNTDRNRFGRTIQGMLARNLGQVDSLNVISNQRLQDILRLELGAEVEFVDVASATTVARQAGITTMIIGSVAQFGEQFVLAAELTDVESGSILDAVSVTAQTEADIIQAVNDLTAGIIRGAGNVAVEETSLYRLQDVATASLTAYELYEQGMDHMNEWRFSQAAQSFSQAIEQDSTFMSAHLGLYRVTSALGFMPTRSLQERQEILSAAMRHSDHATQKEREILAFYRRDMDRDGGNGPNAEAQILADAYPDDKHLQLHAGLRGTGPERFDYYERAVDLDPTFGIIYNMLAYDYMYEGEEDLALSNVRRYLSLQPDIGNALDSAWEIMLGVGREDLAIQALDDVQGADSPTWRRLIALALSGDTVAVWSEWDGVVKATREENQPLVGQTKAQVLFLLGRWEEARIQNASYLRAYRRVGNDTELARRLRRHAAILHAVDRHDEAERHLGEMIEIGNQISEPGFNPYPFLAAYDHAIAYADAGNVERAQFWLKEMETSLMDPTLGLDNRHSRQAEIARSFVAFSEKGIEALNDAPEVTFWIRYLSPPATLLKAWKELAYGDVEKAALNIGFLEHNVSAKNFQISPYTSFFIYSPTAQYRAGVMYEAFNMPEEAMAAYESALERYEQTGATFKYVELTRERLAALTSTN